jgi:hypothetical protein
MSSQFLIIRPDDLVVLGVRWSGFDLRDDSDNTTHIVAATEAAQIVITFPPQATNEVLFRKQQEPFVTSVPSSWARHSGPSHLVFHVARGTAVPLTADGILSAARNSVIVTGEAHGGPEFTTIEMPYGLFVSARARTDSPVVAEHSTLPAMSQSNVCGLWHTRLRGKSASGSDGGLFLKPLRAPSGLDPDFDFGLGVDPSVTMPPMLEGHRLRILRNSEREKLPTVTRLWLSPLGGTLRASAIWSDFEWDHDLSLGRDQRVRFLLKGTLYPFGHRAIFSEYTERSFETPRPRPFDPVPPRPPVDPHPSPDPFDPLNPPIVVPHPGLPPLERDAATVQTAHAGLHSRIRLFITEPIRHSVKDNPRLARQFPFDEVEILEGIFTGLEPSDGQSAFVLRPQHSSTPVLFPIRCVHPSTGDIFFSLPLIFVSQDSGRDENSLKKLWERHADVSLPGTAIDLIRNPNREPGDIHEVHRLTLGAVHHTDGFRPTVKEFEAELPALRSLLPDSKSRATLRFSDAFRDAGDLAAPFRMTPVIVDFVGQPQRSGGLIAPKFKADVISRVLGPVPAIALQGLDQNALAAFEGATLLGMPLNSLIKLTAQEEFRKPPKIVALLDHGKPVGARMEWKLKLVSQGPFRANDSTILNLSVERTPSKGKVECKLRDFSYELPPGPKKLLVLKFEEVAFLQEMGGPPDLKITGLKIQFEGTLKLLNDLALEAQRLLTPSRMPAVRATRDGIFAGYSLGLPKVSTGSFVLRNIAVQLGVDVPFSRLPVIASVGFSSRDNPFSLTVLGLGGGGYIVVRIGGAGIVGFEASMEFGAMVEINLVIVSAEVHAFGGLRFTRTNDLIELEAFIRIGGSVELLGLVSIAVELKVRLIYLPDPNILVGRATVVVEIDVTLFSESVTLDSGVWTLIGSNLSPFRDRPVPAPLRRRALDEWRRYQEAFAA